MRKEKMIIIHPYPSSFLLSLLFALFLCFPLYSISHLFPFYFLSNYLSILSLFPPPVFPLLLILFSLLFSYCSSLLISFPPPLLFIFILLFPLSLSFCHSCLLLCLPLTLCLSPLSSFLPPHSSYFPPLITLPLPRLPPLCVSLLLLFPQFFYLSLLGSTSPFPPRILCLSILLAAFLPHLPSIYLSIYSFSSVISIPSWLFFFLFPSHFSIYTPPLHFIYPSCCFVHLLSSFIPPSCRFLLSYLIYHPFIYLFTLPLFPRTWRTS